MRFITTATRTPTVCHTCNAVYDKETGRGVRHKVADFFVGIIDYYFIVMDKFFELPEKWKMRAERKKQMRIRTGGT